MAGCLRHAPAARPADGLETAGTHSCPASGPAPSGPAPIASRTRTAGRLPLRLAADARGTAGRERCRSYEDPPTAPLGHPLSYATAGVPHGVLAPNVPRVLDAHSGHGRHPVARRAPDDRLGPRLTPSALFGPGVLRTAGARHGPPARGARDGRDVRRGPRGRRARHGRRGGHGPGARDVPRALDDRLGPGDPSEAGHRRNPGGENGHHSVPGARDDTGDLNALQAPRSRSPPAAGESGWPDGRGDQIPSAFRLWPPKPDRNPAFLLLPWARRARRPPAGRYPRLARQQNAPPIQGVRSPPAGPFRRCAPHRCHVHRRRSCRTLTLPLKSPAQMLAVLMDVVLQSAVPGSSSGRRHRPAARQLAFRNAR
jgi:hypothetical protein